MTAPADLPLFPDLGPGPVPDRLKGLGQDARRTLRQADLIAAGYNPGSRLPVRADAAKDRTGPGLRCRGAWGPDMRGWWPACRAFEPAVSACP